MPEINIHHSTTYRYRNPVSLLAHRLLLRPRESRELRLISYDLRISPDADLNWAQDVFGNAVATASFRDKTDCLVIDSKAKVELSAAQWPVFDIDVSAINYPFSYSDRELGDLAAFTAQQYMDADNQLAIWVRGFIAGNPTDTLSLLKDISLGIASTISYQGREEEGTQAPIETIARGWGSCRDFAVLFTEAVRSLGFGARIVSGYLFNPDKTFVGSRDSGSTHAWAEVFLPGAGWITFDPTNRSVGGANLIPVAVTRDITHVAPVSGGFVGQTDSFHSLNVAIEVSTA